MPVKTIRQALQEALVHEMRRDPRVVVIGEDVSGGAGTEGGRDAAGGVLGVTKGLIKEFGEHRVIDTLKRPSWARRRARRSPDCGRWRS